MQRPRTRVYMSPVPIKEYSKGILRKNKVTLLGKGRRYDYYWDDSVAYGFGAPYPSPVVVITKPHLPFSSKFRTMTMPKKVWVEICLKRMGV